MKGCELSIQGYEMGNCLIETGKGKETACSATLKEEGGVIYRRIRSIHLSRPEHYLSIYQSGCNSECRFCHSWYFTQFVEGKWMSPKDITEEAERYEKKVNVIEPKERATSYHAYEAEGESIYSPQGFEPARNIVGFTGGDLLCRPDFYAQCTREIKKKTDLMVLIETNGYGLTNENLGKLKEADVDSFWLDIKAYDGNKHEELTGISNDRILQLPKKILELDFTLEVSSLYIPGHVELRQLEDIARLLASVHEDIPFAILAYFPEYKMYERSPKVEEMIDAYRKAKEAGLKNVRLGNVNISEEVLKNEN